MPAPPVNGDLDDWARDNGGIPASGNYVEVTPNALNGHKVTVLKGGLQVHTSRTDPPLGVYAPFTPGGCGGFLPYGFTLNLDTNPVSVTAKPDEGVLVGLPGGVPRLVELPHEITSGETEVWDLYAVTKACTCEWTATLRWIADDGTGTHTTEITDHGQPFRVATVTRATVVNPDGHGRWA